ncbi:general secretion pathway protein L [Candidatus Magnetomorum sp. HK-1]|nr:general secretion pathway protein L [Candidatus Magnetomorum sp. HK-1]
MPDKVLGLDIQKETVNAVLVKSGFRNPQIISFACVPIQEADDDDQDDWELTLAELKETVDFSGAIPVVAHPASETSFRNLVVPFKDPKKIKQVLPFELEPMMMRPLDQGIVDFQLIEKGDKTRLIACMADISSMHILWDRVKKLDIEPEFIPVESVSTVLCLIGDPKVPDEFIFVDYQFTQSIIIFVTNRTLDFIRRIEYPESSDAERILLRSIYHTRIHFLENVNENFNPEQLFITGARVDENVHEILSEQMDLEIHETNLVERFSIKMEKDVAENWQPNVLDNALALAIIQNNGNTSFNLRQGPFAIKRRWQEYKNEIFNTLLWLIILALSFSSNLFIDNKILEKENAFLTQEVKQIFNKVLPGEKINNPVQQMQERIAILKSSFMVPGDKHSNLSVIDIINLISTLIDKNVDVRFTRFVAEGNEIHISGKTDAFNSVDIMKNKLENARQIETVSVSSSKKERRGDKIVFKLKVTLSDS